MAETSETNFYKPEGGEAQSKKRVGAISWTASEYVDHQQGFWWFTALAVATAALAAGLYFWTHDYFAVGTTVVVGILVGVFAKRTPAKLNYELSAEGLKIEDKSYPFGLFKSFAVISEGQISSIELMPLKRFMPPISVFFETAKEDKIISVLENYLPMEERQLDTVERLSRRLRF